mmetsp:Transcript_12822/g.41911  ORF Transcript_12822/g.41911 Transcript_12822/m.41911 type:complete len:252 (+) Transcript_12822:141-896(+)
MRPRATTPRRAPVSRRWRLCWPTRRTRLRAALRLPLPSCGRCSFSTRTPPRRQDSASMRSGCCCSCTHGFVRQSRRPELTRLAPGVPTGCACSVACAPSAWTPASGPATPPWSPCSGHFSTRTCRRSRLRAGSRPSSTPSSPSSRSCCVGGSTHRSQSRSASCSAPSLCSPRPSSTTSPAYSPCPPSTCSGCARSSCSSPSCGRQTRRCWPRRCPRRSRTCCWSSARRAPLSTRPSWAARSKTCASSPSRW